MPETNDLFIRATKRKFRFNSVRGPLMAEDLWAMHLSARTGHGFDLNNVAITVNAELKALGEESFVETTPNQAKADAADKLEIVKFVIASKQSEAKAAEQRMEKAERARKIREILAQKKDQALTAASEEDLEKMLAAIEAEAA